MCSFQKSRGDQGTNCYCSLLTYCVGNWWAGTDSVFQKMYCQNIHKGLLGSGRRAGMNLRGCSSTETWKIIYLPLNIRKFFLSSCFTTHGFQVFKNSCVLFKPLVQFNFPPCHCLWKPWDPFFISRFVWTYSDLVLLRRIGSAYL